MFGKYSVKIDKDLFRKAKELARNRGYSSMKEFIEHLIEKEISEREKIDDPEKKTEDRLKGLGYIPE